MKTYPVVAILGVLVSICMISCRKDYRSSEGMVWHTTYHITYDGNRDLNDSIYAALAEVGASLNVFDDNSVVSRANASDTTKVDEDFVRVYEMSRKINRETGGAFDPTLGPLIEAWGFGRGHTPTADTLRIDSLLRITGIGRTSLRGSLIVKEDIRIKFNFSAIAKGYGCDRVAEVLRRNGVKNYLVEIGGEIACAGISPSGGKWRISVDKPVATDTICHLSQCIISVTDAGIATSGNYRNFHQEGGHTFGHTISSTTGRPVQTDVVSATVIAASAMEADALATSMMAMGSEKSRHLAVSRQLAVMLITADNKVWESPQFGKLLNEEVSEP